MKLLAKETHIQTIARLCLTMKPDRGCGFLLGDFYKGNKRLLFPYNIVNRSKDSRESFFIDAKTYLDVEKHARDRKADIIGIYHAIPFTESEETPKIENMRLHPWYSVLFFPIKPDNTFGVIKNYRLDKEKENLELEEIDFENWEYYG